MVVDSDADHFPIAQIRDAKLCAAGKPGVCGGQFVGGIGITTRGFAAFKRRAVKGGITSFGRWLFRGRFCAGIAARLGRNSSLREQGHREDGQKKAKRDVLRFPSRLRIGHASSGQLRLVSENYMGLTGKTRKETSRKRQIEQRHLPSAFLESNRYGCQAKAGGRTFTAKAERDTPAICPLRYRPV